MATIESPPSGHAESPADESRRHVTNIVVALVTIVVALAVFILLANFVGTS